MNKSQIRQAILDKLREEFAMRLRVSKVTRDEGNSPESKAESKYDTLAIEENYLADGLARQAHAAGEAAAQIEAMALPVFGANDPIGIGALVELAFDEETEWFFLATAGSGTEVEHAGKTVTVLTPHSPLGAQLLGLRASARTKSPAATVLGVS